jgi:hypothetical protein
VLTVGGRDGERSVLGDEKRTWLWPAEGTVEGYFAARSWYGELTAVLATDGPAGAKAARELARRHADDRLVLEAIADWIDQDLSPETEFRTLAASSQTDGQRWRYTTRQPAAGWYAEDFDDSTWQEGPGGFGRRGTPGAVVRTEWTTSDLWLRRTFELSATQFADLHLVIHHDEDAVIYLNGERIARFSGYVKDYFAEPLAAEVTRLLRPGRNHLAVHCHQTSGGQYIDVGLIEIVREAAVGHVAVARVLDQIDTSAGGEALAGLRARFDRLAAAGAASGRDWAELYLDACMLRRSIRLLPDRQTLGRIVFAKHFNMGGSHYAYTEGQSDAQQERHFYPGSALCLIELDGPFATIRTLIDDPGGVIRNPDVSYDGSHILFAWKQSDREDDYHLYEMDAATGQIRQLTFGLGFADYEGVYLPNGDLLFNSTRCVQTVDCHWSEVSNLYTCDPDGNFLRRLSFDQVHTNFPTVTEDGRVLYTRWDYNDRGQLFPQPLFQMFPDGTGQTEFYGNNSWFPTTIKHARGIPGTQKVLAIATGHHSFQAGKLCILDPARGRQENSGVQLIAPVRETLAERIDAYGQTGDLFQYPYPLSETEYLLTYHPEGWPRRGRPDQFTDPKFGIYWMNIDGHRELLASDPDNSCNQPIPLAPRPRPHHRPSTVDYRRDTGTFSMHDVYAGMALAGVQRGTVRRLRVIALEYRAAGIGRLFGRGPGGQGHPSTPIAVGNGSWDVKVVLGDAEVHADGSALFEVPARTPLYFQALDERGYAVQTMRSWATLQPGEKFACVGCHDHKNTSPPADAGLSLAMKAGVQKLQPFYGPARGFSFANEIQPILDRHCITCHHDRSIVLKDANHAASLPAGNPDGLRAFSLLGQRVHDPHAKRMWSDAYLNLTRSDRVDGQPVMSLEEMLALPWRGPDGYEQLSVRVFQPHPLVNWISAQSVPSMLPPYHAGAATSRLMTMLEEGHHDVRLSREELEKMACWIDLLVPFCGDYTEAHAWSDDELQRYHHYLEKRRGMEAIERENIAAWIELMTADPPHEGVRPPRLVDRPQAAQAVVPNDPPRGRN